MKKIPLAQYLFTRLAQNKVQHMHGVPGDFTLKALDHLSPSGVKWINSCNELNAGYAADGYARIRGLGALLTTYGVGELSAINAIAGSYAEHVPVVGIVGTPRRELQTARANVHHTLGDGRPRVFAEMARHVTVAQANLIHDDEVELVEAVDHVLAACLRESQPVYVELPCDMVNKQVDAARLDTRLDTEVKSDPRREKDAVNAVLQRLAGAKQPLILVDSGHGVRGLRKEINALVEKSGIPTLAMPSGNGLVEHSLRNFYGVHSGPVGQIDTMPYVRGADVVLAIGPMFSDTQTLGWTVVPDADKIITLTKKSIEIPDHGGSPTTTSINLQSFLTSLTEAIDPSSLATPDTSILGDFRCIVPAPADPAAPIDQSNFYLHLNKYLRESDTVLLANATPILGGRDLILPPKATCIASGQWFSIGHMLPAAQGAALAQQQGFHDDVTAKADDGDRQSPSSSSSSSPSLGNTPPTGPRQQSQPRTILLEGDGSFQVTAQELSTAIRYRIPLTVMIVNNSGYAYERQIHGMHEDYNDLAPWRYADLAAKFFGADDYGSKHKQAYPVWTRKISTWKELDETLADEDFNSSAGLKILELVIGKYDVPEKFRDVFKAAGDKLG